MKLRNGLITLTVAGLMAVLLCLPGPVISGGNPPGVGPLQRLIGPNLHANLIMGYRDDNSGIIDGFLRIDDKLYLVEESTGAAANFVNLFRETVNPPEGWNIPLGVVRLSNKIPAQVATDFGFDPTLDDPVFFEEKDISNSKFLCVGVPDGNGDCDFSGLNDCPKDDEGNLLEGVEYFCPVHGPAVGPHVYQYIMHCDAKISFLVPK